MTAHATPDIINEATRAPILLLSRSRRRSCASRRQGPRGEVLGTGMQSSMPVSGTLVAAGES